MILYHYSGYMGRGLSLELAIFELKWDSNGRESNICFQLLSAFNANNDVSFDSRSDMENE